MAMSKRSYAYWQLEDFIKNDGPLGNQVVCQGNEYIPVVDIRACVKETGASKLSLLNITADDPYEMVARGKHVLSQSGWSYSYHSCELSQS